MTSVKALTALRKLGMPLSGMAALGLSLAASLTVLIATSDDLNAALGPADASADAAAAVGEAAAPIVLAQVADDGGPRDPNYGGATPPEHDGWVGPVQDWLARANRAYQGVIVKGLSSPPAGGDDAIARKIEETKGEPEHAASDAPAPAADPATEAMVREAAENADAARDAVKADAQVPPTKRQPPTTPAPRATEPEADTAADIAAKAERQRRENEREEARQREAAERRKAEAEARAVADAKRAREAESLAAAKSARDAERREEAARRDAEQRRSREAEAEHAEAARRSEPDRRDREPVASAASTHRRTITLTTEPIRRPAPTSVMYRPEMASPAARRIAYGAAGHRSGARVKGWSKRRSASAGVCRAAGRRITPPARYVVARGDSLWSISSRHYRNGRQFPKIYRANRQRIADPDLIYPCQKLRVPARRA